MTAIKHMHFNEAKEFWGYQENHDKYDLIMKRLFNKMEAVKALHEVEKTLGLSEYLHMHLRLDAYDSEQMIESADGIYAITTDYPVFFIGDIHSDDESLERIIDMTDPYHREVMLVFLGDYVDRGKRHLATLDKLWALKIDLPYQVVILRGNHDSGYLENNEVKLEYRQDPKSEKDDFFPLYLDRLRSEGHISTEFMDAYFTFSKSLNHVAMVKRTDKWVMGVHAGIPRPRGEENYYDYIPNLASFSDEGIVDHIDRTIVKNMLWSDPREGDGDVIDKGRFSTYEKHYDAFKKRFNISMMIRGHVAEKSGHKGIYDDQVHTIFSSGGPSKTTAYAYVKHPKIMKVYSNAEFEIMEMY